MKKGIKHREAIKHRKPFDPEIGRRIKLLRGTRNQVDFAKLLHVTQTTVSCWEKGRAQPSSEAWLNLGMLARDKDSAWFWKKGGMGLDKMIVAASEYSRGLRSPGKKGELVRIFPLQGLSQAGDVQSGEVLLPAERVRNPASTCYIVLKSDTCGDALAKGDIVVIDKLDSQKDPRSLAPFWGRLIMVEFTHPPGPYQARFSYWQQGFSVGRPCMFDLSNEGKLLHTAKLLPSEGRTGKGDLVLGHWGEELPTKNASSSEARRTEEIWNEKELGARAMKDLRLPDALEVVGEVICILLAGHERTDSIP